jgi:serine/threonine-protein kinase RsbW
MTSATGITPVAATSTQTSWAIEVAFPPDAAQVRRMRMITEASLQLCGTCAPLTENVLLAVSELVTNAVRHGHGTVVLRVSWLAEELRIEVCDGNPSPATLRLAGVEDEAGRGLFLVAVLARNWGVSPDGRTTWCTFRLPAGRA